MNTRWKFYLFLIYRKNMLEAHFLRSFLQFDFALEVKKFKSALFLNTAVHIYKFSNYRICFVISKKKN
jgi:hypothetical protein